MASATATNATDEAPLERGGPAELPPELRQDWPAPWQPLWGPKRGPWREVLSLAARALIAVASRLPDALLRPAFGGMARISYLVLRRRSRTARDFLRQALGPEADLDAAVLQAWRHFFRVVVDTERLPRRVPLERIRDHFEVVWHEGARRVAESGRGCVLVTAHIGNWEAGSAIAPWIGFDPFYAIAKPIRNRPFSKVLQRVREQRGIRLLPRRGAMRDAPRVIQAGGSVGMLLDQRTRQKPVIAPFFGRPARCDRSASVLLRRIGAPVLLVACYMTEKPLHYRVEFVDCLLPEEFAGARPEEVAARINGVYEKMILKHPEQYFWLHDRYRDTPEEMPEESPEGA